MEGLGCSMSESGWSEEEKWRSSFQYWIGSMKRDDGKECQSDSRPCCASSGVLMCAFKRLFQFVPLTARLLISFYVAGNF